MKYIKILFSAFLIFTFIGCNGETTTSPPTFTKLSTPTNVSYDGLLTWDDVDNALNYDVSMNGDTISVNDNFYAFDEEGTYTVYIIAKAPEYIDSDASESISLTIDYDNNVEFNLSHDDDMITWDEISDAIEYNIFIDGIKHNVSNNSYSIDGEDSGVISISVQAVYPIGLSNISDSILVEYNLTETDLLNFQYSTYSTQDVIIWEELTFGNLYVQNIDNEFLNIEDVLMMASNRIHIKSS
nr:hypothetical protein [Bacteroidales bacterium]